MRHGVQHAEVSQIRGVILLPGLKTWASMELQKLTLPKIQGSQGGF